VVKKGGFFLVLAKNEFSREIGHVALKRDINYQLVSLAAATDLWVRFSYGTMTDALSPAFVLLFVRNLSDNTRVV
jgi:hypothetical protein